MIWDRHHGSRALLDVDPLRGRSFGAVVLELKGARAGSIAFEEAQSPGAGLYFAGWARGNGPYLPLEQLPQKALKRCRWDGPLPASLVWGKLKQEGLIKAQPGPCHFSKFSTGGRLVEAGKPCPPLASRRGGFPPGPGPPLLGFAGAGGPGFGGSLWTLMAKSQVFL